MRRNEQIRLLLCLVLLPVLAAACATAPTEAPTAVPPSPTPLAVAAVAQSSSASSATAAPTTAPAAAPATGELTGAPLFEVSCAACHGQDRAGTTFDMDGQKIDVPSLAWSDLSSTYAADPSRGTVEQQVAISITKGQDETGGDLNAMMPRWSFLSQAQVDSLVQFLQTSPASGSAAPTLTPDAANLQGEQLYSAACAACHGADAAGKTFEMDGNKIDTPSLHWSDLSGTYASDPSRGTVEQQVAISITKGQDETGGDLNAMMPRWSFLSQAQVDSLVQYLKTAFP
jgi:mono/diheme cytochrome c family protein